MRLYYWGNERLTNFGDMLNPWLWPKVFPGLLDDESSEMLVGIGTLLNTKLPVAKRTIVLGAGAGYGRLPETDDSWGFFAVRGPLTKKQLGLADNVQLGDPGILAPDFFVDTRPEDRRGPKGPAFIPHWTTRGAGWSKICQRCNVRMIDPFDSVQEVLCALKDSSLVIAEAMHGAIVADGLRVPWIPVRSGFADYSAFKWQDWGAGMDLSFEPRRLIRPWSGLDWDISPSKSLVKAVGGPVQLAAATWRFRRVLQTTPPILSAASKLNERKESLYKAIESVKEKMNG